MYHEDLFLVANVSQIFQGDNSGIFPGLNQYSMPGGAFAQHSEG